MQKDRCQPAHKTGRCEIYGRWPRDIRAKRVMIRLTNEWALVECIIIDGDGREREEGGGRTEGRGVGREFLRPVSWAGLGILT